MTHTGLFDEQIARKPDNYPWAQDFMEAIWAGHWTASEFNFMADYAQFKNDLSPHQRELVVRTLSAIGQIEIAVKTFWSNLGNTLPQPSIRDLGYVMGANEVVHNKAYEKLLDVLGLDHVFEENLKNPVIAGRVNYLRKYSEKVYGRDQRKQFIYALTLFTMFVEGVSLFSQFYIIKHINKKQGFLKDTAQQVAYTIVEESLHLQIGIKLINTLRQEYPELFDDALIKKIKKECKEAIEHERNVISWILGGYSEPDLNVDILDNFVRKKIANAMEQIGIDDHEITYDNDLLKITRWFDEQQKGVTLTDFFASRPVEYVKGEAVSVEDLF